MDAIWNFIAKIFSSSGKMTMKAKAALVSGIALLIVLAAIGTGKFVSARSKTTAFGLRDIGDLTTQVGYFTNVQVIENNQKLWGKTLPFTTSKSIFSYDGVVKAGIDFAQIEYSVDERAHVVTVKMPKAKITDVDVDENSLMVYDEKTSIFTPLLLDDYSQARIALEDTIEADAKSNGLLEQASENAKLLIQNFLAAQYNPNEYNFIFE